jgi:hypothetical protein
MPVDRRVDSECGGKRNGVSTTIARRGDRAALCQVDLEGLDEVKRAAE